MEDQSEILKALQTGVTAAVAQSDNSALPIKYLRRSFSIPQDQKWLELIWIPNDPIENRDNTRHDRGILRLVLHWPNTDTGIYAPVELLASITRYFVKGRLLSGVSISATPTPTGSPIEDGDDVLFPVSIQYQSYRKGA